MTREERTAAVLERLATQYPDAKYELNWDSPFQLLIATILAAQATDERINQVTPILFEKWPTPQALVDADPTELETVLTPTGFFRRKAKAVKDCSRGLLALFGGEVPRTVDELTQLSGVARKTANVVLGNAFGMNEGVVVDTHVGRLALRMGLSRHTDPGKVEQDLMALFPRRDWCLLSHLLIFHGRRACKARGGACASDALCRRFCSESAKPVRKKTAKPKRPSTSRAPRRQAATRPRPSRRSD